MHLFSAWKMTSNIYKMRNNDCVLSPKQWDQDIEHQCLHSDGMHLVSSKQRTGAVDCISEDFTVRSVEFRRT